MTSDLELQLIWDTIWPTGLPKADGTPISQLSSPLHGINSYQHG
jgi:hypothetical protein